MVETLGIDIAVSGIKVAQVDTETEELTTERHRIPTPRPATPDSVADTVRQLVDEIGYSGPVGCCFPTIIIDGVAKSASNMGEEWVDLAVDETFTSATGLPFIVLNDADAAGVAEMRIGAGVGLEGLVITITVGTGIGSALFYRGQLIPNLELGHMAGKGGISIELWASDRARKEEGLSWEEWGERFDRFLGRAARVCTPDHFILGGGVSKKYDNFRHVLTVSTPIHVAHFRNNAGIIGAAMAAMDSR